MKNLIWGCVAAIGAVALIFGFTTGAMNADVEKTKQIELCTAAGGSFQAGSPTICTVP